MFEMREQLKAQYRATQKGQRSLPGLSYFRLLRHFKPEQRKCLNDKLRTANVAS